MSSGGQAVGAFFGAVVGYATGGPSGALRGAQVGMSVGGFIDPPKGPKLHGPRIGDLSVQTSTYGAVIPRAYATIGLTGNIIWLENNQLREVKTTITQGGKGGGGEASAEVFTYFATFAVALCKGPIADVRKIWIGSDLVYDAGSSDTGTIIASGLAANGFVIYKGTDTQQPDPRIQGDRGAANVPAYRGLAYIVFNDLPLAKYGNSLMGAQIKVEVVTEYAPVRPLALAALHTSIGVLFSAMTAENAVGYPFIMDIENGVINVYAWIIYKANTSVQTNIIYTFSYAGKLLAVRKSIASPLLYEYGPLGWNSTPPYWFPCGEMNGGGDRELFPWEGHIYAVPHDEHSPSTRSVLFRSAAFFGVPGVYLDRNLPRDESIMGVIIANDKNTAIVITRNGAMSISGEAVRKWFKIDGDGNVLASGLTDSVVSVFSFSFSRCSGVYRPSPRHASCFDSVRNEIWAINDGFLARWSFVGSVLTRGARYSDADRFNTFDSFSVYASGGVVVLVGDSRIAIFNPPALPEDSVTLAAILTAECLHSKSLALSDLTTASITSSVRGYKVASVAALRSSLAQLQGAWPFDVVQSGYKLKFIPRGGASVATISDAELDARESDAVPGAKIIEAREMAERLPSQVSLSYIDAGRDYTINKQTAARGVAE